MFGSGGFIVCSLIIDISHLINISSNTSILKVAEIVLLTYLLITFLVPFKKNKYFDFLKKEDQKKRK